MTDPNRPQPSSEFVSPEQLSQFIDTARNLLPDATIVAGHDTESKGPEIDSRRASIFGFGDMIVQIIEDDSSVGLHELRVVQTTTEDDFDTMTTMVRQKEYNVDPDNFQAKFRETFRPKSTPSNEITVDDSIEEGVARFRASMKDFFSNLALRQEMGMYDFTSARFEEVMRLLEQCTPDHRL